jgi:hypothetical protein
MEEGKPSGTAVWQANARYFNGRTDELSPSVLDGLYASTIRLFHIMKATV